MKKHILAGTLLALAVICPGLLQGSEESVPPALLERVRQAMSFPDVTVSREEIGRTSLDGVHFFLCKGRFPGTVDGAVIARTAVMREPITLTVQDAKGNLLLSCQLDAEQESKCSISFFTLSETFVSEAKLLLFTVDATRQLKLSAVAQRKETVLELGDPINRVLKQKETANKTNGE